MKEHSKDYWERLHFWVIISPMVTTFFGCAVILAFRRSIVERHYFFDFYEILGTEARFGGHVTEVFVAYADFTLALSLLLAVFFSALLIFRQSDIHFTPERFKVLNSPTPRQAIFAGFIVLLGLFALASLLSVPAIAERYSPNGHLPAMFMFSAASTVMCFLFTCIVVLILMFLSVHKTISRR